jgi:hypothetical protein
MSSLPLASHCPSLLKASELTVPECPVCTTSSGFCAQAKQGINNHTPTHKINLARIGASHARVKIEPQICADTPRSYSFCSSASIWLEDIGFSASGG